MKVNLLVLGAIIAISAMMVMMPTATTEVNAVCAGGGSTKACAGGGNAFAKALGAFAFVFNGIAGAGTK